QKKRLNFAQSEKEQSDIVFQTIIDEVINVFDNIFLLVVINEYKYAENFFAHLLTFDFKSGLGNFQKILAEKKAWIVVVVDRPEFIKRLNSSDKNRFNSRIHVPFLRLRLLTAYGAERAYELAAIIERQRTLGKWASNEEDFCEQISRVLSANPEEFAKLVDEKENGMAKDHTYDVAANKETALKLVHDGDILHRYVGYVAANFRDLTLSEFHYVMYTLISDPNKVEVIPNPLKPAENTEKALLDRWKNTADVIMAKYHLKESPSGNDNKTRIIDFEIPGFHSIFKEEFGAAWNWFSHQQFNYLFFTKGVLFNPDTPPRVLDNVIRISAEIANVDPDLYCKRLLLYSTLLIINQEAKIDVQIDPNEDLLASFLYVLDQIKEKKFELELRKMESFRKVSLLIEKMHTHENLRHIIGQFLDLLMHNLLHDAVLFFVRYMRKFPEFDALYWIRQLLERGRASVKKESYQLLIRIMSETTSQQIFRSLEKVMEWHGKKQIRLSGSSAASLAMIVDYLFIMVQNTNYEDYGKFPFRFNLLSGVATEQEGVEKLELLTDWLLNPDLRDGYIAVDSFFDNNTSGYDFYPDVLSQLIVLLKAMLSGFGKQASDENGNRLPQVFGNKFTELLAKKTNKDQRRALKGGFLKWQKEFFTQSQQRNPYSKEHRQHFQLLSRVSGGLLTHLNKPLNQVK
ncbi:MAG TPA: hypothetical protein VD996_01470, partial [Chitinophagaceae bacterium]|nr:hypothetical protein [Chitinophagaceae bacterium]